MAVGRLGAPSKSHITQLTFMVEKQLPIWGTSLSLGTLCTADFFHLLNISDPSVSDLQKTKTGFLQHHKLAPRWSLAPHLGQGKVQAIAP